MKKLYNKVIKITAIAVAAPSYGFTKATKAVVYGVTENATARSLADLLDLSGELLMMGACGIDS